MAIRSWLLLLLALVSSSLRADGIVALNHWLEETRQLEFKPYSAAETLTGEQLFLQLFAINESTQDTQPKQLQSLARSLGVELHQFEQPFPLWLLVDTQRGMGIYILPRQPLPETLAIQIPHRRSDRHTQELAVQWLAQQPAAAYAFNSLPRNTIDLAHEPDSLFVAFARAYAQQFPSGKLVQLHGFASAKRHTEAAKNVSIIISSGTRIPSRYAERASSCLGQQEAASRLYPLQVNELGGTRNASGLALRATGHSGFLHLELSFEFRQRWLADPSVGQEVWRCLN